jgi:hypothetical protein
MDPMAQVRAESEGRQEANYQEDLQSKAYADKKTSPAKGTKTCLVKQWTSAHQTKKYHESAQRIGSVLNYMTQSSNIHFRVDRNGSLGVAVGESTYPGMRSYFLIGEQRYSADGDRYADVTTALPLLRKEAVIKYAWHKWPYRNEVNQEDVFAGFSEAYDQCLRFLRGTES